MFSSIDDRVSLPIEIDLNSFQFLLLHTQGNCIDQRNVRGRDLCCIVEVVLNLYCPKCAGVYK